MNFLYESRRNNHSLIKITLLGIIFRSIVVYFIVQFQKMKRETVEISFSMRNETNFMCFIKIWKWVFLGLNTLRILTHITEYLLPSV